MGSEILRRACIGKCCAKSRSSQAKIAAGAGQEFASRITSSLQFSAEYTNHESIPSLDEVVSRLMAALPHYLNTVLADSIRAREYSHLSASHRVCLDYIGQGLFSSSQIESSDIATSSQKAAPFLDTSPSSPNSIEAAIRRRIVKYMNLCGDDYSLVFTANESSAFKLVAESYPFRTNRSLLTVYDHENEAVETMIATAKRRGARAHSAAFSWPNLRVTAGRLRRMIANKSKTKNRGLFVFPLHSRVTGSQYSYQWMNFARENGWHVLLDGCDLGPKEMDTLGLAIFQPDFLICSFYMIFGLNPAGFCCLFIKKTFTEHLLQTPASIGIISLVPPQISFNHSISGEINRESHQFQSSSEIQEMDPTPIPEEIAEIECRGLDHADTLGLILISRRVRYLINWLINALLSLRHPNSDNRGPLVRIFGPKVKLSRGASMAFNVYDWKGERVEPILVQKLASRNGISVNCGYLKNIWFPENLSEEEQKVVESGSKRGESGFGVVSVSLSMMTDLEDAYRFWCFVARFLDADYVNKEIWRFTALNLRTVEL